VRCSAARPGRRLHLDLVVTVPLPRKFAPGKRPRHGVVGGARKTRTRRADQRAREALAHYDRAIDRLRAGDWAAFGAELDAMRPLLEELNRQPAAR
jgi:hypothetical protein